MTSAQERTLKMRLSVAHHFRKRCYVCHRKIGDGKGFTYHHLWYEQNEKRYKDFKKQEQYYRYLIPKIKKNPKRFLLLCNPHHQAIERLHRFSEDKMKRVYRAARKTKT